MIIKPILKKVFLFNLILLCNLKAFSQIVINVDSLTEKMCYSLNTDSYESDSASLVNMFAKHLSGYVGKISESELDSIYTKCFFRLQVTCKLFKTILDKIDPGNDDWVSVNEMPKSKLSRSECDDFFSLTKYKYLENNGDTTIVHLTQRSWQDYFIDGTYSKLTLKRTSASDFDLIFLESNNLSRKNMSNTGDTYSYRILEKKNGYYLMLIHIKKSSQMATFKLYY
ncbi:MAG: hypothetical protein KGZ74_17050 [Chitinophagaceae bacterium]|nr:hypothetical protein [Chitinophagaceae bacterium]